MSRSGGATQVVKDSTSQADYGRFDGGSFEVAPSTDDDAFQNGSWFVATHKNPRTRLASLPVDLLVEGTTATAQAVLAATIGTKVQITGMPSQAPSSTFTGFIEGATERIGVDEWSIEFFTSPVTLEDSVWVLEDATYGAIDSTNVIAF